MPTVIATPVSATPHMDGDVAGSGLPSKDGYIVNNEQNRAVLLVDDGHNFSNEADALEPLRIRDPSLDPETANLFRQQYAVDTKKKWSHLLLSGGAKIDYVYASLDGMNAVKTLIKATQLAMQANKANTIEMDSSIKLSSK